MPDFFLLLIMLLFASFAFAESEESCHMEIKVGEQSNGYQVSFAGRKCKQGDKLWITFSLYASPPGTRDSYMLVRDIQDYCDFNYQISHFPPKSQSTAPQIHEILCKADFHPVYFD